MTMDKIVTATLKCKICKRYFKMWTVSSGKELEDLKRIHQAFYALGWQIDVLVKDRLCCFCPLHAIPEPQKRGNKK